MEAIAIIGAACRFPGAPDLASFWRLLHEGVDAITEVPPERWDVDAFYDPNPKTPGKMVTRWGGFLPGVDRFDGNFFGIAPSECERMDPQQRLVLEVAWEALEHAGIPADTLAGSPAGVFIGISHSDYDRITNRDPVRCSAFNGTGSYHSIAANRLSFVLDLRGPSMVVDTACSSSLSALHIACQSLRLGESDLAIAGAVNLTLTPEETISLSRARAMAPDGRCKTFDQRADGYVRGEGCGIVVLKRLSAAIRDGNKIHALIRGSAVNQDGHSNGLTAPNGLAQEAVIRQALANAGVAPAQLSYVEAHGTGTPLGDHIEMRALKKTLLEDRAPDRICWIGSVKTNIGHLEAAGGIAGLLKVMLAMRHDEIPAHLHLQEMNRLISLEGIPLAIPRERQPWVPAGRPRFAGVSSFGFGGTNTHVVMEEAPRPAARPRVADRSVHVLALSAKSEAALGDLARRYVAALEAIGDHPVADLCFTSNTGRSRMECRLAAVGAGAAALAAVLRGFADQQASDGLHRGEVKRKQPVKLLFSFGAEATRWSPAASALYFSTPVFRTALEDCLPEILKVCPFTAVDREFPEILAEAASLPPIDALIAAHLRDAAVEVAQVALWRSWGIVPGAVAGAGLGEFVAAHVAGALTLFETFSLIAARARHLADPEHSLEPGVAVTRLESLLPIIPVAIGQRPEEGFAATVHLGPSPDWSHLAATAGELFTRGAPVDWVAFDRPFPRTLVDAPHYPFQRSRHWMD